MLTVKYFTFGPFQENTYVLYDDTNDCVIIDAGCYTSSEQAVLRDFIKDKRLRPVLLLSTHSHVDHITGNRFVFDAFGLKPNIHLSDLETLKSQERVCAMYGLNYDPSPLPETFIEEGDEIKFGNTVLSVLYTPGHAPGHVVYYNKENRLLINGDVLFKGSIGRTDLPGGDFDTLMKSIKEKIFTLPDETIVYCGHGPVTQVGYEKAHNPFVSEG